MRTICRSTVLGMVVGLLVFLVSQASAGDAQQKACDLDRTIKVTMKYLLYLPKDYEQKPSWPLMLFLHGAGERGDDLNVVKKHGPPKLIEVGKECPFIVVSPQCPNRKSWEPAAVKASKPSAEVVAQKAYVPEPQPVRTQILVGAHNCPLWEADKPQMWNQVLKHPERTPALGFYSQENPEVADWETKWAVEHGVSFFVYCWYRNGQGGPVKMNFGSAIHEALLKSRYVSKIKFTIMWENQSRGTAGVSGEADLMENLLPFWVENYFRHPSYLKIDDKPLLFIYRPEFLIQDLGGVDKVRAALDKMRSACRKAGFNGLYILGEYRGLDPKQLELMKELGLDYTFAYCWHVAGSPKPEQAIAAQLDYINKTRRMGILPEVVTVSQGWSGWQDEGSIWKIPPAQYKGLLEKAKAIIRTFPATELGSKILLLDNWNEWSEGHYIAPHREFGFGYLDAVREVFSDAPKQHVDLLPRDVGMGPYDQAYKRQASPRK